MAIYHLSVQVISRSQGRSAVAATAYRAGEKLKDERTGLDHDFSKRKEIESEIFAPDHAPLWDRERLWNEVEKAENRKDAQVAREINVALPKELTPKQQRELIQDYVKDQFVKHGMIADVAIHRDKPENPHAHIMLTTREITPDGFGKKNREWNTKEYLEKWREGWERHANYALERAGIQERIDHRSFEKQGIVDRLPQIHEGVHARAMENKGIQTDRGDHNRMVKEHNGIVRDLAAYREENQRWNHFTPKEKEAVKKAAKFVKSYVDLPKIEERFEQIQRWETKIEKNNKYLEWKGNTFDKAQVHWDQIKFSEDHIQNYQKQIDNINWLNPLKVKENRASRDYAEKQIAKEQRNIEYHNKKLNYSREKLEYTTKEEFHEKFNSFRKDRTEQKFKNQQSTVLIHEERKALKEAKQALENIEIRRIADQYPDWKAAKHLTYDGAKAIEEINKRIDGVASPQDILKQYEKRNAKEKSFINEIQQIRNNTDRLTKAKDYLEEYEKLTTELEKLEKVSGKINRFFSSKAKNNYNEAVHKQEMYRKLMFDHGIKDRNDFNNQMQANVIQQTDRLPELEREVSNMKEGLNLFSRAARAIDRAKNELALEKLHGLRKYAGERDDDWELEKEREFEWDR